MEGKRGGGPGQEEDDPHPADPAFRVVEESGEKEGHQELQVDGHHQKDQGVPGALQIDRVLEELPIAVRIASQNQSIENGVDDDERRRHDDIRDHKE